MRDAEELSHPISRSLTGHGAAPSLSLVCPDCPQVRLSPPCRLVALCSLHVDWVPCAYTFPELARLVAQLAFQQAVGRPVTVCSAHEAPREVAARGGGAPLELAEPGGALLSLAQDIEQTQAAQAAAIKLSGRGGARPTKGAASGSGGGGGGGSAAGGVAGVTASGASQAATASEPSSPLSQAATMRSGKRGGGGGGGETLAAAIRRVANEYGGKKRADGLEAAISKLVNRWSNGQ